MKKSIAVLFFTILIASSIAINVQDYLYPNENAASDVRYEAFSISGVKYEIVYIKNKETFLLKEGNIVNDSEEIKTALKAYYVSRYYLTPSQAANLTELFKELNASRNNGEGRFQRAGEEQTCRERVGEKYQLPSDYEKLYGDEYMYWATLIVVNWGGEIGINDPDIIYQPIKDFWAATRSVDERMNGIFTYLNNLSADNVYEGLLYMNSSMPIIESNYQVMKNSILRFPLNIKECPKCLGICPPIIYNETCMAQLNLLLPQLIAQTKPIGTYLQISEDILKRTEERVAYKTSEDLTGYYSEIYGPMKPTAEDVLNRSEESLSFVMNTSFAKKVDELKTLKTDIESSIANKKFDGMEEKIDRFADLMKEINETIEPNKKWYFDAEHEKDKVTGMIFLLETKDLSSEEVAQLSQYKVEKNNLDGGFVKGLSPDMYAEYSQRYVALQEKLKPLMEAKEEHVIIKNAKAFSKNAGETTSDLILSIRDMPTSEREDVLNVLPAALSAFSYLSLTSLLVIASSIVYLRIRGRFTTANQKTYYWIGVGVIAIILILLNVGFYILLDRSLLHANFEDFSDVIAENSEVAVVVDYAGAPQTAAEPMSTCAEKIIHNLIAQNKTVAFYVYTDKCIINGVETNKNRKQCNDEISVPRIVLKYSNVEQNPSFSTTMDVKGVISGDESYFNLCPISAVMGGVE
ncbi:MAG: hypothetical protein QXY05_02480 [Candidatus Anstonellales archaeon]